MPTLALRNGDWTAEVAPALGGAILSLRRAGEDILRPTPPEALREGDVRRTACYPLVPYANRIADGRFTFEGRAVALPPRPPGGAHAIHGVGWRRAWRVEAAAPHRAEISLDHQPDDDWPFAFRAQQRFELEPTGLTLTLALTNTGAAAAPGGIGLHPFFPDAATAALSFAAEGGWENDARLLPGRCSAALAEPFRSSCAVGELIIDNDLFGWDGVACVTWPRRPPLRLSADASLRHLRVFHPPEGAFFAVEPVSHMADAANRPGTPRNGWRRLAPGETLAGAVRFEVFA